MEHNEAIKQMVAERYLLGELSPEQRDAFEEHAFDCSECSLELRAGAAFIDAAKVELPKLTPASPAPSVPYSPRPDRKRINWQSWLRPAFAIPAFAALLAVVGYQNLSTIPSLRMAATQPSLLPSTAFHAGTRGAAHTQVQADRTQGAVLSIELPQDSGVATYSFTLYDPQGKQLWTRTLTAAKAGASGDGIVSLVIPGIGLTQGSYTLAIAGIDPQGTRTEIDRHALDIQFVD
ncbi:zf-HC2 domain-containing protein [Telmatobacter sp. DSM 110680]|uniref:Zf-HC2 domain-containing protein n=1 Tax=Telmatobacter sp. DSM 110680 TaxID=3036704 RepID=A0AAU7DS71_9BACT